MHFVHDNVLNTMYIQCTFNVCTICIQCTFPCTLTFNVFNPMYIHCTLLQHKVHSMYITMYITNVHCNVHLTANKLCLSCTCLYNFQCSSNSTLCGTFLSFFMHFYCTLQCTLHVQFDVYRICLQCTL